MPFPGEKRWLLLGVALAILASYFAPQFNRYYLGVAIDVGIAIILATSLNLINGHTGQFSLGHAGFMAVGGFFSAWLSLKAGVTADAFWFFPLALVAGGLLSAVVGLLVGVPSLRLRGDYLAIVTLGFGEIIRVVAQNTEAIGAASGLKGIPKLTTLGWTFGFAAVTIYAITALVNSTYGRGFIAVHDDEIAAESNGVDTTRTKVTAFVTGAFFAGIAGGLYAHHKQFLSPTGFDWLKSIDIVVMVILGGMGRTVGVIAAAILLTLMPELLRDFSEYRMILYALLIILLMLLRPAGLFSFNLKRRKHS
ncbi:branched-chain amino acid ABC transporter permease [Luteolibacter yonseiensis]|uniref:Branched-chain amino acid ABC transporter permease n=1 Tax=Luteolibacter yonseiensis TaxID=1144680 RepID=A0A934VCK6_9BACT|nr:branched-chain amino acid ABC transporter permease [Luteolibacter yonseiensis]MBK1817071.1 branched-chain amino acid ABC transporter permease [Luteolibacter yonseiensis]